MVGWWELSQHCWSVGGVVGVLFATAVAVVGRGGVSLLIRPLGGDDGVWVTAVGVVFGEQQLLPILR